MHIVMGCSTCEWNFDGICASHESFGGYGSAVNPKQLGKRRSCWSLGLSYYSKLVDLLPDEIRDKFLFTDASMDNLLRYHQGFSTRLSIIKR